MTNEETIALLVIALIAAVGVAGFCIGYVWGLAAKDEVSK